MVLVQSGAPAIAYVEDADWNSLTPGTLIADADFGTGAPEPAIFGVNAFKTIGAALSAITIGGQVIVNGGSYSTENITLSGTQTLTVTTSAAVTVGTLTSASGQIVQLNGTSLNISGAGNSTLAGTLNGSGKLIKSGGGTLTLSVANTHGGGTQLDVGVLDLLNNGVFGTSGTFTINGGTIQATGGTRDLSQRRHNWRGFCRGQHKQHRLGHGSHGIGLNGGTRAITVTNASMDLFFDGVVSNGGLTKIGAGRLACNRR